MLLRGTDPIARRDGIARGLAAGGAYETRPIMIDHADGSAIDGWAARPGWIESRLADRG